ncbi:hypothetical protein BV508_30400 [Mycobacterium intermedium]|nr:hypothetical protein BV508_30400 [Mycobacterium intermedium]
MVLVEGENADGVTVETEELQVSNTSNSATNQVVAAILGTQADANEAGHQVSSIGVTWTDQIGAAALRDALTAHRVDQVMLVSAFLAAAALAQSVGQENGYERIAMLLVERDTATLAVVAAADGAIDDIHKEPLDAPNRMAQLARLAAEAETLDTHPEGLFIVGPDVDTASMKWQLQTATSLTIVVPEEPETALARGAALASAHPSTVAFYTEAIASDHDSDTEPIFSGVMAASYADGHVASPGIDGGDDEKLAYSEIPDEDKDTEALTVVLDADEETSLNETLQPRRPMLLLGSIAAVGLISAVVALEVALALGIRDTAVAVRPLPGQNFVFPTEQGAPGPNTSAPSPQLIQLIVPEVNPVPARSPPTSTRSPP